MWARKSSLVWNIRANGFGVKVNGRLVTHCLHSFPFVCLAGPGSRVPRKQSREGRREAEFSYGDVIRQYTYEIREKSKKENFPLIWSKISTYPLSMLANCNSFQELEISKAKCELNSKALSKVKTPVSHFQTIPSMGWLYPPPETYSSAVTSKEQLGILFKDILPVKFSPPFEAKHFTWHIFSILMFQTQSPSRLWAQSGHCQLKGY